MAADEKRAGNAKGVENMHKNTSLVYFPTELYIDSPQDSFDSCLWSVINHLKHRYMLNPKHIKMNSFGGFLKKCSFPPHCEISLSTWNEITFRGQIYSLKIAFLMTMAI